LRKSLEQEAADGQATRQAVAIEPDAIGKPIISGHPHDEQATRTMSLPS
jgi:hypothetical protein